MSDILRSTAQRPVGTADDAGADTCWRSTFVTACPVPLPARERGTEAAVKIIAWSIDEGNTLRGLAIRADGTACLVALDDLIFDHSLRPTMY